MDPQHKAEMTLYIKRNNNNNNNNAYDFLKVRFDLT